MTRQIAFAPLPPFILIDSEHFHVERLMPISFVPISKNVIDNRFIMMITLHIIDDEFAL